MFYSQQISIINTFPTAATMLCIRSSDLTHLRVESLCHSTNVFSPFPPPFGSGQLLSYSLRLWVWIFLKILYISEIIWYLFFPVWLILLNIMPSRCIYSVSNDFHYFSWLDNISLYVWTYIYIYIYIYIYTHTYITSLLLCYVLYITLQNVGKKNVFIIILLYILFVDEHLVCFHILGFVSNAAMNMNADVILVPCVHFLWV